ncbi:LSU ribosomal protein L18P [Ezakiella coagulans]|uniref:Large ribosomal subunit protein uL18 n=1 Tax=Ezakiella coagulans TaxID=46507 RepID=A0A2U1E6T7_9FIRM|nr:50S ribosomal protein L18 [Ezakiella coagulans]KGF06791.1 50S ribosomal protein L18 [Tissierellia bacterium S7-1-4]PVY95658.1 LSU ribosomal protein L18P [Ezakiella coagulans]UQK61339.1 50S ribosomal protein L18 [Ezakiella coagulans]
MIKKVDKNQTRIKRHLRVRNKVNGTAERPRLCVRRSSKHIYAQIIDDVEMRTLAAASSLDKELGLEHTSNKEAAKKVGELVAKRAIKNGIKEVVFDRGGYVYHGRIKELAEGAREAGLDF